MITVERNVEAMEKEHDIFTRGNVVEYWAGGENGAYQVMVTENSRGSEREEQKATPGFFLGVRLHSPADLQGLEQTFVKGSFRQFRGRIVLEF